MFYYDIVLPLAIDKPLTYSSSIELIRGSRVIIKVRNASYTGIVWQKTAQISPEIKYLPILEIVDHSRLMPETILKLAEWVAEYYHTPLGISLFAMLPSALDVVIQTEIRLSENIDHATLSPKAVNLLKSLDDQLWTPIEKIKKSFSGSGFYLLLEELEAAEYIEIKRTFDKKIKKKIANFVIRKKIEDMPDLTPKQLELYDFICSAGEELPLSKIASSFSYALVKALRTKNLIDIKPREILPTDTLFPTQRHPQNITPNPEQVNAINAIASALDENVFKPFLLYGITGSGKTEVYIQSIKKTLAEGKSALMLVPEISLTPQMVERFYNAFGENIAILHSRLNDRQRWQQWQNIRKGQSRIVIGARSAIFAPLKDIGIIIVDEEHENSYKQDTAPRYNGRDLAVMRAYLEKTVIVLGSATPSLESWHNTSIGKYSLLKLTKRPGNFKLPQVQIIDMKNMPDNKGFFSSELTSMIADRLKKKEQIILFQNRRGHSSFIQCLKCGLLIKCPNCDISMNYHSFNDTMICHYCGLVKQVPRKCPDCGSFLFNYGAPGTQQIEEQLKILFPQAHILRMDSDTTTSSSSYQNMFDRMKSHSIDILLGTQMISKGLDFPNVTLVGVISADVGLSFPDFRAGEATFQLLTQVAGRSGRGEIDGNVIIQTYNPTHYAITCAMSQDFPAFADIELSDRELLHYAPFFRLARIIFSGEKEPFIITTLNKYKPLFQKIEDAFPKGDIYLIGPAPAPLTRIKNKFRYHIFIKAKNNQVINKAVSLLEANLKLPSSIKLTIDIDPQNML
ncbi:MAG: primosomal protein N' [Candidatus Stygibacter australis]|nr:primosomal protein N' [Candidatus Stygibacter australis]